MHRIAVLVVDGIHSFDLSMPLQVFSTAHSLEKEPGELFGPRLYDLRVCGEAREVVVAGVGGVEMFGCTPPYTLADDHDGVRVERIGAASGSPPSARGVHG